MRRSTWCAALAAAIALAAPAVAQANEVTHWNRIAMSTLVAFPGRGGGAPPALQIKVAVTRAAVYAAVTQRGGRGYEPYLLRQRFPQRTSREAAAATAAYLVL